MFKLTPKLKLGAWSYPLKLSTGYTNARYMPNHFLLGVSCAAFSPGVFDRRDISLRSRWWQSQALIDQFWQHWIWEYLPTLTRRTKWNYHSKPIEVNDVVIVINENLPRNRWTKGRIITIHPGRDGVIRAVNVKTSMGTFRWPVTRLCILDVGTNQVNDQEWLPLVSHWGRYVAAQYKCTCLKGPYACAWGPMGMCT